MNRSPMAKYGIMCSRTDQSKSGERKHDADAHAFRCSERVRTPRMSVVTRSDHFGKACRNGDFYTVGQRRIEFANEHAMHP